MFKKLLISVAVLLCLLGVGLYYTVFYTATPLNLVQKILSAMKVETQGISGSLAAGAHLDRLHFESEDNFFTLENFRFSYSGLWDYVVKKEFNISEIAVGKLHIKVKPTGDADKNNSSQKNDSPSQPHNTQVVASEGPRRTVKITNINISNIKFDFPGLTTPFEIENCQINDVKLVDGKIHFNSIAVKSNILDLDFQSQRDLSSGDGADSASKAITGSLKPTYIKRLKQAVSFSGKFHLTNGTMDKIDFLTTAFDNKLVLQINNAGLLVMKVDNLSLIDFLNDVPPISRLKLDFTLGPKLTDLNTLKVSDGEFYIGQNKFAIIAGNIFHKLDNTTQRHQLRIEGQGLFDSVRVVTRFVVTTSNDGKVSTTEHKVDAAIEVATEPKLPDAEILSRLLFNKKFAVLNEGEKQEIARNSAFFTFK